MRKPLKTVRKNCPKKEILYKVSFLELFLIMVSIYGKNVYPRKSFFFLAKVCFSWNFSGYVCVWDFDFENRKLTRNDHTRFPHLSKKIQRNFQKFEENSQIKQAKAFLLEMKTKSSNCLFLEIGFSPSFPFLRKLPKKDLSSFSIFRNEICPLFFLFSSFFLFRKKQKENFLKKKYLRRIDTF